MIYTFIYSGWLKLQKRHHSHSEMDEFYLFIWKCMVKLLHLWLWTNMASHTKHKSRVWIRSLCKCTHTVYICPLWSIFIQEKVGTCMCFNIWPKLTKISIFWSSEVSSLFPFIWLYKLIYVKLFSLMSPAALILHRCIKWIYMNGLCGSSFPYLFNHPHFSASLSASSTRR